MTDWSVLSSYNTARTFARRSVKHEAPARPAGLACLYARAFNLGDEILQEIASENQFYEVTELQVAAVQERV